MSDKTLVSTSCPYCIGYTDAAGFHHGFNCPILIPEQLADWDNTKTPFGELQDIATDLKVENDALRAQHVAEMEAKVEALEWRDKEICTLRKQLELYNVSSNDLLDAYHTTLSDAIRCAKERDELQRKLDILKQAILDNKDDLIFPKEWCDDALAEIEKVGKDANEKL